MVDDASQDPSTSGELTVVDDELEGWSQSKRRKYARFMLSALSGIPWVGGLLSAAASLHGETDQSKVNELQRQWLREHERKLSLLGRDLTEIVQRVDELGPAAGDRLEDAAFLALVEQAFKAWDRSATEDKRTLLKKLLTNAAGMTLCSDDIVRLFIEWIDRYHESHFAVIREVYRDPGITRAEIWQGIHGEEVREDSAEADLFKLLIRDLSAGGVIRQHRETTSTGEFIRKGRGSARRRSSSTMKSAFDSGDPYELTELGKQFVHYALTDLVPRIGSADSPKVEPAV